MFERDKGTEVQTAVLHNKRYTRGKKERKGN